LNIVHYSLENLVEPCVNKWNTKESIIDKRHFRFFDTYLKHEDCQGILIEDNYISKDYIDNYQFYYSLCFDDYPKKCKRLHFLSKKFTPEELSKISIGDTALSEEFMDSYLGFTVIRPISHKVFGITILKPYADIPKEALWGKRAYNVHVLGLEFEIQSLAFQEQDGALSACATAAIWSILSKTNSLNYTLLKTPNQITKDAAIVANKGGRLFPNKGLVIEQICTSIYKAGLDTELVKGTEKDDIRYKALIEREENLCDQNLPEYIQEYNSKDYVSAEQLQTVVNAYSKLGIPILAVIQPEKDRELHAVTILGHKEKEVNIEDVNLLHHESITRVYAHDDQWGPFTKLNISDQKNYGIDTIWTESSGGHSKLLSIIIPVNRKVRINHDDIREVLIGIHIVLPELINPEGKYKNTYDYFVINSNDYKSAIRIDPTVSEDQKVTLIYDSLPRYIWVISAFMDDEKIVDLIFDATDVNSNMYGIYKIYYNGYKRGIEEAIDNVPDDEITKIIKWIKAEKPDLKFNPGYISNFLVKI